MKGHGEWGVIEKTHHYLPPRWISEKGEEERVSVCAVCSSTTSFAVHLSRRWMNTDATFEGRGSNQNRGGSHFEKKKNMY